MDEQTAVRIEDYLNDKLQSQADLDNVDALLSTVQEQQALLRRQLAEAEGGLAASRREASAHSAALLDRADAFRRKQASIDKRLLIATGSASSEKEEEEEREEGAIGEAVRRFEGTMGKLRKLDVAQGYVDLLGEVDRLTAEARRNFRASPKAALAPYVRLQELAAGIKSARPAAEEAAPHLADHVDGTIRDLWKGMKDSFSHEFEKTLDKMKWPPREPGKGIPLSGLLEQEWISGVERLLELQQPELKAREADPSSLDAEPVVLLPLEVMVKPLALRFRYHFSGDRPTNRLDKPEFFLSHVADLLNDYDPFFSVHLQPILYRHLKGSALALNPAYIDSASALITSLLPMLREKLRDLLPQIANQPQLLSHLIHELMSFDSSLRNTWGYEGGRGAKGWDGLTAEVLREWFGRWLEVEKDFSLQRYQNIIEAPDSGEIDFESMDAGETKPTKAAIRVNDLLETVTDRYRPLTSFSQKLRFLIDIQITIFERYHERLHSALEAFLTLTSTIARTVQGVSKEEAAQLQGLGGIERLCRVYGSAEYLERKMRDWSDDVFFLEMWDELQYRARRHDGGDGKDPQKSLAGGMTLQDVAGRTSSVVGSKEEEQGDTGALFDETSSAFRRLRVRAEGILQEQIFAELRRLLQPYSRANPWASLSSPPAAAAALAEEEKPSSSNNTGTSSGAGPSPSPELDAALGYLSQALGFLARCLAMAPLRRVARQVAQHLQAWLCDGVAFAAKHKFSTAGARQLRADARAVWAVFDAHCAGGAGGGGGRRRGAGYGRACMPRLADALTLMNLPLDESEESADGPGRQGIAMDEDAASTGLTIGLQDAERRIFTSNEEARRVLDELGLDNLTEADARTLVEKRIELARWA